MVKSQQIGGSPLAGVKTVEVHVQIFPWDDESHPLSEERLQQEVEHALRKARMKVVDHAAAEKDPDAGLLNVVIAVEHLIVGTENEAYAVVVHVRHEETVRLCRNESIVRLTETWSNIPEHVLLRILPFRVLEREVRRLLDEEVARFIRAYLAANPGTQIQK